ncbi:MAG TPA: phosphotransferase [Acidimicrobiales bacterium]|nr:phosphotransferase [Acidimicrobiales bacterium]
MESSTEPVRVLASIDELLAGASHREPLVASDGKSGNELERVVVDGRRLVVKHMTLAGDWIMRVTGDRVFWPYLAARAGLYDRVPSCIDHAVVAMALEGDALTGMLHVVMRDVGDEVIPEGDAPVTVEQHRGFLTHMAEMHASYWGWRDQVGLQSMEQRLLPFAPATIAPELARVDVAGPVAVAHEGWSQLGQRAPSLADLVFRLHGDPGPLVVALATTPTTFLQGDWKMGNLGWHPDGRTILLDWAYLGAGPATWDLMWYLALNCARLPESKESSIETYRAALEAAGVETESWWERQVGLAAIGMMVCFAWEKAVGVDDELAWWVDRVDDARRWLHGL